MDMKTIFTLCLVLFSITPLRCDQNTTGKIVSYIFEPLVTIIDSDHMTETMKLEAVQILRRSIDEGLDNPCKELRDYFMETYFNYIWNCVEYKSYAIHRDISIDLKADDVKYALFGLVIKTLRN
ncbi:hypothetical protein RN001_012925 [Aquatica leii]|uniref:Uncharacterized protein n=1 Tax=Aquatica leii TaxID=1421715 RepID=A0AAN7NVT8_9COLE|nr:hypothetical protein RN001_012925 [Aquatica leii]